MAGSSFGNLFRITTWGESHGKAIGVVIDGCPAGIPLSESDIQTFLDRRKPGQSKYTTKRAESDRVEILSGVFDEKTTGAPISLIVPNEDQRSRDYGNLAYTYRPGHADYTFDAKYGIRDYRGGGRSSGRETIGRVAAGAVAAKLLSELGITVTAYTKAIGPITVPEKDYSYSDIFSNPLYMPNSSYAKEAEQFLAVCMAEQDSAGGIIECVATGVPKGLGETVFEKLDANLAKAIMSIGAVKGVEIGDGFAAAKEKGSTNNDAFCIRNGSTEKVTNHSGGILGGMSDGSPILLRAAIKPTPSISKEQQTVTSHGTEEPLVIKGRHDPVIVPRAVVVVESMVALTLADMLLQNMSSTMERIRRFYETDFSI